MKRFRKEWILAKKLVPYPDLDHVYVSCYLKSGYGTVALIL